MYLCHTEQFKPSFHDTVSVVEIGGGGVGGIKKERWRRKENSRKSREIYMEKRKVIVSDKVVWL